MHAAPCRPTVNGLELDNPSLTCLGIVVSGLPGSRYFNPLEKCEISVWHPFCIFSPAQGHKLNSVPTMTQEALSARVTFRFLLSPSKVI